VLIKEVLVDTNALFIPCEFGVDIFEELERLGYRHIIVLKAVMNELDRLRRELKGKEKRAANVGYSLLLRYLHAPEQEQVPGRCKVTLNESDVGEMNTDELIVEVAFKRNAAVLTIDEPLKRELTKAGITTVYLRGKCRLEEKV
jgi:rRNA-processing protein FCF1